MKYVSTRGRAPALDFDDVLLAGLARDGGLYVPASWPRFAAAEIASWRHLDYAQLAARVMAPLVGDAIPDSDLKAMLADTYAGFGEGVAPLKPLGDGEYLLELFHGPTLAFKDYAMQFLGRAFDYVLKKRQSRVTIVGATSGDTGSAAIEACRGRGAIDIFILYPDGRVSDVQRRQMTTVAAANVRTLAVRGTFDDCQDLVKGLFNDEDFRGRHHLSAVNSINWARIAPQIVYYFWAALKVGAPERPVSFAVPTGNFGNVFAGYCAMRMGLDIGRFLVGSNANDILTRFFMDKDMSVQGVIPTLSPSMDIQVSSNFERLLFEAAGRDGARVTRLMSDFRSTGRLDVDDGEWRFMRRHFEAHRLDDAGTKAVIKSVYADSGLLVDPHSAVGIAAGRARTGGATDAQPLVALATAHPAKFPDATFAATGIHPQLPPHMADLFERPERLNVIDNHLGALEAFINQSLAEVS